jgi:hypothetical protein
MAGWIQNKGYRVISVTVEGRHTTMLEHRWIMQQHLGRALTRQEVVHHINHDKLDNRLANLQLMAKADHDNHHDNLAEGRGQGGSWNKGMKLYGEVACAICGVKILRELKYLTRNAKRGSRTVCGPSCRAKSATQ